MRGTNIDFNAFSIQRLYFGSDLPRGPRRVFHVISKRDSNHVLGLRKDWRTGFSDGGFFSLLFSLLFSFLFFSLVRAFQIGATPTYNLYAGTYLVLFNPSHCNIVVIIAVSFNFNCKFFQIAKPRAGFQNPLKIAVTNT